MTSNFKAKVIFLLRHTQTDWNRASRYQGRIDTRLSAEGMKQAAMITNLAKSGDFDLIITSPLCRASVIANSIAAEVGCPVIEDDRITEIAMGPWEGLTRDEIRTQFPEMFDTWQTKSSQVHFPGGECLDDVAERVRSFISELFRPNAESPVLVVSHDAVIKVCLMLAMGLELDHLHRFRMRNGSVSILRGRVFEGSVDAVDGTSHLSGSPFRLPL